jgi:hypothetical protein
VPRGPSAVDGLLISVGPPIATLGGRIKVHRYKG